MTVFLRLAACLIIGAKGAASAFPVKMLHKMTAVKQDVVTDSDMSFEKGFN